MIKIERFINRPIKRINMTYHLNDLFEDGDLEQPTEQLIEVGREMVAAYEEVTGSTPRKIYLVGGIAREDTSEIGRKDIDFLIVPVQPISALEENTFHFMLTAPIRDTFNMEYDVFVGDLEKREDGSLLDHLDITNYFF
jgi:predicted nucleotidyltransferase